MLKDKVAHLVKENASSRKLKLTNAIIAFSKKTLDVTN